MELMFEVISRQKFSLGQSASYVFSNVGGYIGRGAECEWVLPDKMQKISRKHVLISCDGAAFYMEDISTNGIFATLGKEKLPKGIRHKVEHGASFLIGDYTVQARLLHRPDAYISQDISKSDELIPEDVLLDLDPLMAMEQQEQHVAKMRLGMYHDLLGTASAEPVFQSDHNEPRIDAMPEVSAIPENWEEDEAAQMSVPADSLSVKPLLKSTGVNRGVSPNTSTTVSQIKPVQVDGSAATPELEVFFRLLGFDKAPDSPEARETILRNCAELIAVSVDCMIQALHNRAESKNELRLPITTVRLTGNNPLKFSPTAQAALEYLLVPKQNGMLPAGQAMTAAFEDLHGHHMGILAGARSAVRSAMEKLSPRHVEARLDINGMVKFSRVSRLWSTYERMHQELLEDKSALAAIFLQDFAKAYHAQIRTLNPILPNGKGV